MLAATSALNESGIATVPPRPVDAALGAVACPGMGLPAQADSSAMKARKESDEAGSCAIHRGGQGRNPNAINPAISRAAGVCRPPVYNREKWPRSNARSRQYPARAPLTPRRTTNDEGCPESTACRGYAAAAADSPLAPHAFTRRALRDNDVRIDIRYCGVCHSDLHQARNDWRNTVYPCIPGHEIVGQVAAVGPSVKRYKAGDWVAVGCLVDSCRECSECNAGREVFCQKGATLTYNGKDRQTGEITFGGYSSHIVVRDEFVLRMPDGLDPARAAPLLCAGITTYSPLRHWQVGPGSKVAVAGLGGLGHMGVKLANAMGAEVTVLTRSAAKADEAKALGAHHVLLSSDPDAMKRATGTFDFVLDTIPVVHELDPYLRLVRTHGALVLVGVIDTIPAFSSRLLIGGRKTLSGSAIGGIAETQELLDFCAEKGIVADCEMTTMPQINEAFERMEKGDVRYRFVVDMQTL